MKILVVEDDRNMLQSIVTALQEHVGVEVLTATTGDEAIRSATKHLPNIIVLDLMLPARSGFLVLHNIQEIRDYLPRIIVITAIQGRRHMQYAQSHGVHDYLVKPFQIERLQSVVSRHVRTLERIGDE